MLSRHFQLLKLIVRKISSQNVIGSKGQQVEIPKVSLHGFIWKNLDKWADNTATVCFETKRSYTYHQLYKKSLAVTRFLNKNLKLEKHDTVGLVLPNIPEFPIVLLGAVQAGLRVTTCNPNYTSYEMKNQLTNSQTKVIFTTRELLPLVRQAANVPIVEISGDRSVSSGAISFDEISSGEGQNPVRDVTVDDTVFLPYSSGTTGLPKGVQLSHTNIVANLIQLVAPEFSLIERSEGKDQDVIPAFLPLFHIYGLVVVLFQALVQGSQVVTMPTFSSENFIKLLKNYKNGVIYGVPLVVIMANNSPHITKEDFLGVRYLMSGAAPLGASDVERFRQKTDDKICIIQGYGMTETSPVTIMQTNKLPQGLKTGGSGFLLPNTQAKIVPTDGTNESLGPHQPGELLIKGPQNMQGYLNNPQANQDIFLDDGWLRTGDIAYYDEDDHFYVIDRCKELIKVKGFQVPPAELEEVLRSHPSVDDCGVVGVPHPVLGEAPKAFVVFKAGHRAKSLDLEEYVAEKVSKHKHLVGGVVEVEAIPKSASGKILRRELKKM